MSTEPSLDRVEGDVPERFSEMLLGLDETRPEPPFKEMAVEGVALVEGFRVLAVQVMHSD